LRFFERDRFDYDTELPCQAVVSARRFARGLVFEFLPRLQGAFYTEIRDITDRASLLALAGEIGVDRARFADDFDAEDARRETSMDF